MNRIYIYIFAPEEPAGVHSFAMNCSVRCLLLTSPTSHLANSVSDCQFIAEKPKGKDRRHLIKDRRLSGLSVFRSACFRTQSCLQGEELDVGFR